MDIRLTKVKWQCALIYLDDIVIFWRTVDEHIDHFRQVLALSHDQSSALNLKKPELFLIRIDYLGHIIRPWRIEVSTRRIDAVSRLGYSTTLTEAPSFSCWVLSFDAPFQNLPCFAASLNKNLSQDQLLTFDYLADNEISALETPKARLVELSMLALSHWPSAFTVNMDAWDEKTGFILLQQQSDKTDKPIGYWSRLFIDTECAYDMMHQECLSLLWKVFLLRLYLEGYKFTVRNDGDALKWIFNLLDSTGKLVHWRSRLSKLKFVFVDCANIKHWAADAWSRLNNIRTDQTPTEDDVLVLCITASISSEEDNRKLCLCNTTTYLTTKRYLEYLKYTLLRHQWTTSTKNRW